MGASQAAATAGTAHLAAEAWLEIESAALGDTAGVETMATGAEMGGGTVAPSPKSAGRSADATFLLGRAAVDTVTVTPCVPVGGVAPCGAAPGIAEAAGQVAASSSGVERAAGAAGLVSAVAVIAGTAYRLAAGRATGAAT